MAGGEAFALRLDMAAALAAATAEGSDLIWLDRGQGPQTCNPLPEGDIVLARKDVPASYHLSVVVDDAAQGVTLVTRGADLFEASHVHRLLQQLLGLPVPDYHHHRLVTDETGERLAKRADALSLRALRAAGRSPAEVIALAGLEESPR
jgi:glutamyl-Q tRNA(Asp) synthetase